MQLINAVENISSSLEKANARAETYRLLQQVLSARKKCIESFCSNACGFCSCWLGEYYGTQKTLTGKVIVDRAKVVYYDKNCHKGILNRFVPESYPLFAAFIKYKLDFSGRNPEITQNFVPMVSEQDKTHFWNDSCLRKLVSVPISGTSCVESMLESGVEYLLHGVMSDASEVKTSDIYFINKVLRLPKRPYAVIPVERSLYTNDPNFYSVYILFNYLNSFKYYYSSGLNIIPLIIGSTEDQIRLCCSVLKGWGFKHVAWSLSGLNKVHNPNRVRRWYRIISSYFDQVVMINFLPLKSYFSKAVFVSPDWYLVPYIFGRRVKVKNLSHGKCFCHFCKGLVDCQISPKNLALCNLFSIFSFFESFKQSTIEEFSCQKE